MSNHQPLYIGSFMYDINCIACMVVLGDVKFHTSIYLFMIRMNILYSANGGGEKLWRIWRNERHSPIFYPAKFQIHLQ